MRSETRLRHLWPFVAALLMLLLAIFIVSPVAAQDGSSARVDSGAINVRSGPGVGYGVVEVVYGGRSVSMIGRNSSGSWVKVRTGSGTEGWVNSTLIFPSAPIQSLSVVGSVTEIVNAGVVNTGSINVRTGPSTSYAVVTTAGRGASLGLLGRTADASWVKINTSSGHQGWVNAGLLTTPANIHALPVLPAPAITFTDVNTARVATSLLNIRSGPSRSNGIVFNVYRDALVTMVGRNATTEWIYVRTADGPSGWVASYLIFPNAPYSGLPVLNASGAVVGHSGSAHPSSGSATGTVASAGHGTATVFVRGLHVRSGPGLGYGITSGLYYGNRVAMAGRSADNHWVKVYLPHGGSGWISSQYIYTSVYVYTLPVANE